MSNPFAQHNQSQGPRFGNAYENDLPPMSSTGYNNAWEESNKTEYTAPMPEPIHTTDAPPLHQQPQPQPQQQSAYKFTGTPYANQEHQYTPVATHENAKPSVGPKPWNGETYQPPHQGLFWIRFILLWASVGHLGFAAGARPVTYFYIEFKKKKMAALSILWSCFLVLHYFYRRVAKKSQINRPALFLIDFFMVAMWGVGVIVEVVMFRCTDGSKFCQFYDVSLFFGWVAFIGYIVALLFDIFTECCRKRR
ncbi:uncharacterized protein EV154DRAFT_584260 [Mucor mucedo]|uniref:uncharacterized protein n=1 Tax=Mucor mucedo TaxID=29922 RepID=UPI002220A759|nr:uncharacterized protein EV154DRAFT_584260 [Mucor mucedo]KAI7892987.1 hypothetical protein EV154DRAFT_584260 [Mucor mucedo]